MGADDVTVEFSDADCDDNTDSATGSVKLTSNGVGFECDNPYDPSDLHDLECLECLEPDQCDREKFNQHFPLTRSPRVATFALKSTSTFTISLGIECEKDVGANCNRNFLFSGTYEVCTAA